MTKRLRIGDVITYREPLIPSLQTGTVIGHPAYAPDHDIVVIAPDPPRGRMWSVLNDDWCGPARGRDIARARSERYRLRQGAPYGFLERPKPGWSR